jgi:hypothetical protein
LEELILDINWMSMVLHELLLRSELELLLPEQPAKFVPRTTSLRITPTNASRPNSVPLRIRLSGFYFEANETAVALGYQKKREVGVSAQEVQAILPEIIAPAPIDDKYMTVRYEKLIPLLIEAIKEQQKQIEELKSLLSNNK